jgi:hypothetical protein
MKQQGFASQLRGGNNVPSSEESEFPYRRSEPVTFSQKIPFPTPEELGRTEIVPGERRSSRTSTTEELERSEIVPPPRQSQSTQTFSSSNNSKLKFAPVQRWERCKNAELQASITGTGFATLSEYGKFIYYLTTGNTFGVNNTRFQSNNIQNNAGQTLGVAAPNETKF